MLYMLAYYLTIKKIYIYSSGKEGCMWVTGENTHSEMLMSKEMQTVKDKSTRGLLRAVGFKCQIKWGVVSLENRGAPWWMLAVSLISKLDTQTLVLPEHVYRQWTSLRLSLRASSLWVIQEQYWKLNDWAVLLCKFRENIYIYFLRI